MEAGTTGTAAGAGATREARDAGRDGSTTISIFIGRSVESTLWMDSTRESRVIHQLAVWMCESKQASKQREHERHIAEKFQERKRSDVDVLFTC